MLESILVFVKKVRKKRDDNPAGEVLWDFLIDNTVGGSRGGLPKHFEDKFHDKDVIKEIFTGELDRYFNRPNILDFGSSLNRFLVDYSIKELVISELGFTSFDEMTNETKKSSFWYYPENQLPVFDDIIREEY